MALELTYNASGIIIEVNGHPVSSVQAFEDVIDEVGGLTKTLTPAGVLVAVNGYDWRSVQALEELIDEIGTLTKTLSPDGTLVAVNGVSVNSSAVWVPVIEEVTAVPANKLFIIAGQSNANGRGATGDLTNPAYGQAFAPVQMYIKSGGGVLDPQVWQVDVGPVDTDEWFSGFVGTEVSVARDLDTAQPGLWTIGKMAIDGSGLYQHWKVGSGVPTASEYASLLITYAQAWAAAQEADVGAIFWLQGEQDAAIDAGFGAQYETLLTALVAAWRSALGNVPFILVGLHADCTATNAALIRAQQESFAANVANVALIDPDDLTLTDGLHYSADSIVALGQRAVAAYLAMV